MAVINSLSSRNSVFYGQNLPAEERSSRIRFPKIYADPDPQLWLLHPPPTFFGLVFWYTVNIDLTVFFLLGYFILTPSYCDTEII